MRILFTLLFLWSTCASAQEDPRILLYTGRLIDGVSEEPRLNQTIIIIEDRIADIQEGFVTPNRSDSVVDLRAYTVMPGLMDMHVHIEEEFNEDVYLNRYKLNDADIALRANVYAYRTLMAGFTTVRDLGGTGINTSLRNAINQNITIGPRIFSAGKAIGTTGGHADPTNGWRKDLMGDPGPHEGVINGPDDARKAVRQRYKNGADCIKITATGGVLSQAKNGTNPQFTDEELKAIVETARDYGFTTAAHAHGDEGMQRAVRAGITSIEHGTFMSEETMDLMIQHGTYYVPTISAGKEVASKAEIDGYYPEIVVPKALTVGPQIQQTFADAYTRGVKIAFGTDAGVFEHGTNAQEFIYMVEVGMPEMEAIQSATRVPAEMLGIDDELGTIEQGKIADIVGVRGNPLDDISLMMKISFVMKEGMIYKTAVR
ncbi:MAG TPA: amidohydrolase [Flavobacteriales bacterium]|jgi:imidazolonepropionase-like amidohydrolase|nr:amidohydrolase [Flavobacteriales bacterium]